MLTTKLAKSDNKIVTTIKYLNKLYNFIIISQNLCSLQALNYFSGYTCMFSLKIS